MLSDKAIKEYQAIFKNEFGKNITKAEAQEQGEKLLRLFKIIYKPISKDFLKQKRKVLSKK